MAGLILTCVLIATLVSVVASRLILSRYNRAVLASMQTSRTPGIRFVLAAPGLRRREGRAGLRLIRIQPRGAPASAAMERAALRRRRFLRALVVAGSAHAATAALLLSAALAEGESPRLAPVRVAVLWALLMWTMLPTLAAVGALRLTQAAALAGLGVVALATIAPAYLLTAAYLVGIPFLGTWLLLEPRVRALGPFVFAATYTVIFALFFGIQLALGLGAQIGPHVFPLAFVLLASAAFGLGLLGAFVLLAWCASRYRRKRTSDRLLLFECWWLVHTLWICMVLAQEWGAAGVLGLTAFAAYELAMLLQLREKVGRDQGQPVPLLLLRVFGFRSRTEGLLAGIGDLWRSVGTICLIAAPDLATATLEPHETLEYLTGRLSRQFVAGGADLDRRVGDLDVLTDPDGRFRVTEFFCHENTWQATLQRLAGDARVVLMDLRSFSSSNKGCEFELEQLLRLVPLETILLLTDETTDETLLDEMLQDKWMSVAEGSVNDGDDTPSLRVMSLPHGWKNYEALMATLGGIADGRGSAASHSSPVGAA